ncbi:MAG: serine hydrolase domain-containing protein [Candidatus Tumulicola sp.]
MRRCAFVFLALVACGFPPAGRAAIADFAFTPRMAAAIDRIAQDQIRAGLTPGIALGVVADGRIVYARGFGKANLNKNLPMQGDTEFYAADLTKQFTAAAVLMLAQDGKLKLDDKVTKYVPELSAVAANVTVAELLTQTSGLPDYAQSADLTRSVKSNDLLLGINAQKPAAPPAAVFADNPVNYLVAGIIVERASGEPLSDFLQQRIFFPLVMSRTFLAGDTGLSPARAVGYTHGSGNGGFVAARTWDPAWLGGDRGLVTTVYDLAKWDIEMPILLRVDAERTMFEPSASIGPAKYGMGWVVDQRGGKRFLWYAGQIPGYQSINALLPDEHIAVIVSVNADSLHGGKVASPAAVAARVLDVIAPPSTAHLDNAIVARAQEWLQRLADKHIDRTQLTPAFSTYLTDDLVSRSNFAALGKLQTIVPISSTTEANGDTLYEFIVRYPRAQYRYKFALAGDGKIDELVLAD